MPESRDRLIREEPISLQLIFPRRSVGGSGSSSSSTEQDRGFGNGGVGERTQLGSPFQFGSMGVMGRPGSLMGSGGVGSIRRIGYGGSGGGSGSPWGLNGSRLGGQENRNGGGGGRSRGRSTRSLLPAWYPRRPLQDLTPVVDTGLYWASVEHKSSVPHMKGESRQRMLLLMPRFSCGVGAIEILVSKAIQRRRTRLREAEAHRPDSPLQQQDFSTPVANAPSRHSISLTSPMPTGTIKKFKHPLQVRTENLQGNQGDAGTKFMTPPKKLLNSIDQVEKVMKEEFKRMKRTPKAKRVERNNKVRTLMAMR